MSLSPVYPTARAVALAAAGAPAALLIGALAPRFWYAGVGWTLFVIALTLIDALTGAAPRRLAASLALPARVNVGERIAATVRLAFPGDGPGVAEIALALPPLLAAERGDRATVRLAGGGGEAALPLRAVRRGTARIERLWVRWQGALGLVWKQREEALDRATLVTPDIRPARLQGAALFVREAAHGLAAQLDRGDGAEFEALAEYRPGMDRRAIDWKQSARHAKLLAREYRAERNNSIVLAIDSGRAMAEPVDGVARLDRAVAAALLAAYVALKLGDRVSLFGFDSRPRVAGGAVSGARAFGQLQQLAAAIDYSHEETNYTLGLTTLGGQLQRRSLVILFTELTDPTSAELMVSAAARLLERHLVLFVVLADAELEALAAAEPVAPADVVRAATAYALLRERRTVIARARRLGIHVLEAPHRRIGLGLVERYLDMKRRNLL